MFRVIIAGGRNLSSPHHYELVDKAILASGFFPKITHIISGRARGIDALGELWAKRNNIPIIYFKADWEQFGKSAGPRRNKEMIQVADALIAIWDGESKGTRNVILLAQQKDIPLYTLVVREEETEEKWNPLSLIFE